MPDKRETLFRHICNIEPVATSHGIGEKRIIANEYNVGKPITQIAKTKLLAGEKVEVHIHPTMDEHFFFLDGACDVDVDGMHHQCVTGDYLFVPATCLHGIAVLEDTTMITIGIAKHKA